MALKPLTRWTRAAIFAATASLPLLLALGLVRSLKLPAPPAPPAPMTLTEVSVPSADLLEVWFDEQRYAWPPTEGVPTIELNELPADIDALSVERRKALFFRALLPLVLAENRLLAEQRAWLTREFARGRLDPDSDAWRQASDLAWRHRVEGDVNDARTRELLLRRVDEVPVSLVLAQAANESGWGTSRFAREANNLFGVWTWDRNAGVVPARRRADARHLVRDYPDLRSSVRGYMRNINVGHAYAEFRRLRAQLRAAGLPLDPIHLAGGLTRYSARGDAYVAEIRALIARNELTRLDGVRLAAEPDAASP
jgi:Bax protein